jgi:hypothetical protein
MNKKQDRDQINQQLGEFLKTKGITKVKTKRKATGYRKKYNNSLDLCPECGSSLTVEKGGGISCSQDKLNAWYKQFLDYEKANDKEKRAILNDLNKEKANQFEILYERWKYKDKGNRPNFICSYNNRLHSPVPSYKYFIKDVLQIKHLEKILRRPLSEGESNGIIKIKYKDKNGKMVEEFIEQILFPWGLL